MLKPYDVMKLPEGKHCDGDCLWLYVKGGSRSWVVRKDVNGKRREVGLGSANALSLALARKNRDALLEQWRNGVDPIEERRKAKEEAAKRKTFAEAAEAVIEARRPGWQVSELKGEASTLVQWTKDMAVDCKSITGKGVDLIDHDDIKAIALPIIKRGHLARAKALLGRIEMVLEYAIGERWRTADNPATWRRVERLFPAKTERKRNHASVPWTEVPSFIERLRASDAVSARIVEFVILTCTRSQEARGARWSEIDLGRRIWTVPASRMKKGLKHEIPLSDQAVELLERMQVDRVLARNEGDFVFAGGRGERARSANKAMSNQSVWNLVQRLVDGDAEATVHGFRSSFMIWATKTGVDWRLAERCLAHEAGSEVQQAYGGIQRDQLTEERRPIMAAWAAFVDGRDNVVPFEKRVA
jgi:integrase